RNPRHRLGKISRNDLQQIPHHGCHPLTFYMSQPRTLSHVVEQRLCIGCGACAYFRPDDVHLRDFSAEGIRPVITGSPEKADEALAVCPMVQTDFGALTGYPAADRLGDERFQQDWGQVLEIWEGHATDPDIRFKGSSG